jgi:hypothetical protein
VIIGLFIAAALYGLALLLGLALTFTIYIVDDLAHQFAWELPAGLLFGDFLLAMVSALNSAVRICWHA